MKKNIAIFFGGQSVEHDVSIITAHYPIIQTLLTDHDYDVWPVYIARNGEWYCHKKLNNLSFFKQENFAQELNKLPKLMIKLNPRLQFIWSGWKTRIVEIDIAFPALHGTNGEDGSLMGFLNMANIPYIGCDLFSSAICMDKVLTKQILENEKIPVVPYVWFYKKDWFKNKASCLSKIKQLEWPLFVKPVHLGSSIALTKVRTQSQLKQALEVAFHYDDKVLVENSIENLIEITLPIIGNDVLQVAGIERPLLKTDCFSFEEKYLSGAKIGRGVNQQYSEIPAKLNKKKSAEVINIAKKAYRVLGCSGIARIDILIDKLRNTIYISEINTLPGSLYIHKWRQIGLSARDLIKQLIELGIEKFNQRTSIVSSFDSTILKHAGGKKFAA